MDEFKLKFRFLSCRYLSGDSNMHAFYSLISGVRSQQRRRNYSEDVVRTRTHPLKEYVGSYQGILTHRYHASILRQTIYQIDDIVEVITVNEFLRNSVSKELEKAEDASKILIGISAGAMITGSWLLCANICTAGTVTLGIGALGVIAGLTRFSQFSHELGEWRNKLPQYIKVRQNLPLKRYKGIYQGKLIGQFILPEEANNIWREDIETAKNSLQNGFYGRRQDQSNAVHEFAKFTPLDAPYVSYFEDEQSKPDSYNLGLKVRSLIQYYDKRTAEYEIRQDLLIKAREGEIALSNRPYDMGQSAISTIQTIDTVIDSNQPENVQDQQNRATNRLAKNVGFMGASFAVEGLRISSEVSIKATYEGKLNELKWQYESEVADLLDPILDVYKQYTKPIAKL